MPTMHLDEDVMMGDTVIPSTELNGNGDHAATIDPSKILAHSTDVESPGLTYNVGIKPSSTPKLCSTAPRTHEIYAKAEPDDMEVIPTASSSKASLSTTVQVRVPPAPTFPPLPQASMKTGLVYDAGMRFHAEFPDNIISEDIHPEDPRRIAEIFEAIQRAGLIQGPDEAEDDAHADHCWRILARHATKAEICLVHLPSHYDFIEALQYKGPAELKRISDSHDSIYFNDATFNCATLAVGGAIEACRSVFRGDVRNAIAIIRPPGHHAENHVASGFCIFNNVPIAARVVQHDFPETCRKVLILDWDVHHGNGVQHTFYDDPNVLYISLHVYKDGNFYPNLPDADYTFAGEGPGLGKNVNIPWSDINMGDPEYMHAFQEVVMPIATEFNPDLVIISAGFDAADGDALGGCHVTPSCYAHMTHMLMGLAGGKVAVCLEGGYNLEAISRSALAVTKTLMLQPPQRLPENNGPKASAVNVVSAVKRHHSRYWKCLYPKKVNKSDPSFHNTMRLHEIIRAFQSQELAQEQRMIPLCINRSGIARTFEHNVLATPEFMERHPLLVVFHDPPDFGVETDPTGKAELHNSWLADVTKDYVIWAIKNGFQVIDVNIPKIITTENDDGSFASSTDTETRTQQTREFAGYLWENYIEPNNATQVFFMGIGQAYLGLVDMLGSYENCTEDNSPVQCLIGFLSDTAVSSIKRPTDDNIGAWYYDHSLIFVENDHPVFDRARVRKPRRKWGNLIRSEKTKLQDMLACHKTRVQEYLLEKKRASEDADMDLEGNTTDSSSAQIQPSLPYESPVPRTGSVVQDLGPSMVGAKHMPKLGYFSVGSPRVRTGSPHLPTGSSSPLRSDFRRT